MAWVAFDRGVQACERFGRNGPVERWRKARSEIHAEVCRRGFDTELNSFTQFYGSKRLDASLLIIPLVGFLPGDDPRMIGTVVALVNTAFNLAQASHPSPIEQRRPEEQPA